jgi:rhodanese-related sulfurtransferase
MAGAGRRALAGVALLGGALAPFAGSPDRAQRARVDVARLAGVVAREEDHVTALELARWIKDRREGLRVIDLRPPEAFDEYHVPGSLSLDITALPSAAFAPTDTVVLVSEAGGHAAQGWVFLQALGHRQVYFLRGGMAEWMDDVISPVASSQQSPVLTRYFGGVAREREAAPARGPRRGGC